MSELFVFDAYTVSAISKLLIVGAISASVVMGIYYLSKLPEKYSAAISIVVLLFLLSCCTLNIAKMEREIGKPTQDQQTRGGV